MSIEKIELESQVPKKSWSLLIIKRICKIYLLVQILLWIFFTTKPYLLQENESEGLPSLVLLNSLKTNHAGEWLRDYSQDNQLAGINMRMVYYTLNRFKQFGLDNAYIDEYTSFMSYPLDQSLSLIANNSIIYKPSLIEDNIDEDPNSFYKVPAFLGYAANGNVTAEYVYCNYGTFEDFQQLIDLGVYLEGKIAIIRYGAIFRGLKIKYAQEHGMIAVLLYTDTYDDGEVTVQNGFKPYPEGLARNPSTIQRGSAQFLSMTPGDPTTPGYAIKPGENKSRSDPYSTIPKIPALPISYKEVIPILQKLSGYGPKINDWKGLVDGYDYSIGPNPSYKLNLYNKQEFNISTMHNIMGKIEGDDNSKFILIGNHHDSWTPSAGDPHSGSSTLLEIIRAFGDLLQTGWKPRISIVFASWDGEEYGLIGSTEFAEYYEHKLNKECIAYINSDVAAVGSILELHSSPLLNDLLLETAKELQYPNSSISLYDHFMEKNGKIGTLGSGSDYTVFLEHLGIPSVDLGFGNDLKKSAVYPYHSLYDSYHWMEKFGDPGFVYHNLMAKYMSLIILHLSDEPVLRIRTNDYATSLKSYFDDLNIPKEWLYGSEKNHKKSCKHDDRDISPVVILKKKIEAKLFELEAETLAFDSDLEKLVELHKSWDSLPFWKKLKLKFKTTGANSTLHYYERHLLDDDGLNDRPWFKHFVYASGRHTGYKGQELPGLAEAIEDMNFDDFVNKMKKFDDILRHLIHMSSL